MSNKNEGAKRYLMEAYNALVRLDRVGRDSAHMSHPKDTLFEPLSDGDMREYHLRVAREAAMRALELMVLTEDT